MIDISPDHSPYENRRLLACCIWGTRKINFKYNFRVFHQILKNYKNIAIVLYQSRSLVYTILYQTNELL